MINVEEIFVNDKHVLWWSNFKFDYWKILTGIILNLILSPNHRFIVKKKLFVKECYDIVHDFKFWISLKCHWNPWEKNPFIF